MVKKQDKNQFNFDFNFNFASEPNVSKSAGGSQEALSDFEFELCRVMKACLDDCSKRQQDPLDRVEVAARMTRKLGRDITKSHIDQWVAMSAVQRRIHVDSLKALCEVMDDYRPMHVFVEACGFKALNPEEALAAEYGSKMLFKRMIDADVKDILSNINEDELRRLLINRIIGVKA